MTTARLATHLHGNEHSLTKRQATPERSLPEYNGESLQSHLVETVAETVYNLLAVGRDFLYIHALEQFLECLHT